MRTESLQHRLLLVLTFWSSVVASNVKLFAQNVGLLVDTRLDPLVNPGTCSSHVHSVYGNAQFGATVQHDIFEDDDWRNTEGKYNQTTSDLIPNMSSYWAPSIYIWHEINQKYYLVPSFARPYYRIKIRDDDDRSNVHPFPKFLRLIVGDASRKNYWEPGNIDRDNIRWTLTTFNRKITNYLEHGDWSYLVDNLNITDQGQVEMNLHFPDCLEVDSNGTPKTESLGFRSHADYSSNRYPYCPESHPYRIPRLSLEVRYRIKSMRDLLGADVVDNVRNWRLSTNDASGAGAHADFISGWPQEMMENIIANCKDNTSKGDNADCILDDFELNGRFEKSVPFDNPVPQEQVHEVTSLPMGNCPPIGCRDDPLFAYRNKKAKSCNWVARRPNKKCSKEWQERLLSDWCPVACNQC